MNDFPSTCKRLEYKCVRSFGKWPFQGKQGMFVIEGVSAKPCQATIRVKKKIFAKGPEPPHVVLNAIEKHGPLFLSLVFTLFFEL